MATPIRKLLLVGLGGIGGYTLMQIRRRFLEEFGRFDLPAIEYLYLDTDPDPTVGMYASEKGEDDFTRLARFRPADGVGGGEMVSIAVEPTRLERIMRGDPESEGLKEALSWFDFESVSLKPSALTAGAGGSRALGRIGFLISTFDPKNVLFTTVQAKLTRLASLTPTDRVWEPWQNKFILEDGPIGVIVFASAAGGTGSGTFLDFAYYLRWLLYNDDPPKGSRHPGRGVVMPGVNAELDESLFNLYLYMPELFLRKVKPSEASPFDANVNRITLTSSGAYAALCELERYMNADAGLQKFRFEGGKKGIDYFIPDWDRWNRETGKPFANDMLRTKAPYNWVYLIGSQSNNGTSLSDNQYAVQMVANKIFLLLRERDQGTLWSSVMSNSRLLGGVALKGDQLRSKGPTDRSFSATYSAFGLSRIYVASQQYRRWAAAVLAEKFLERAFPEVGSEGAAGSSAAVLTEPLTAERIPASAIQQAKSDLERQSWTLEKLFAALAPSVLEPTQRAFQSGLKFDEFCRTAKVGSCFGNSAALKARSEELRKSLLAAWAAPEGLQDTVETILLKEGVAAATAYLDALWFRIKSDRDAAELAMATDVKYLSDFDERPLALLRSQQTLISWLGEHNNPGVATAAKRILVESHQHLGQLVDILDPTHTVDADARFAWGIAAGAFFRKFLRDDCVRSWRSLIPQEFPSTPSGVQELRDTVSQLKSAHEELRTSLPQTIKDILGRAAAILADLQKEVEALQKTIGTRGVPATNLRRKVADILVRQTDKGKKGLRVKMESFQRPEVADETQPDRFKGTTLLDKEQLEYEAIEPWLAQLFKNSFRGRSSDGIRRPWDLSKLTEDELDESIERLIQGILDHPEDIIRRKDGRAAALGSIYYREDAEPGELTHDVAHAVRFCGSYVRYSTPTGDGAGPPAISRRVYIPRASDEDSFYTDAARRFDALKPFAYGGSDIVALQMDDRIPLPLVAEVDTLRSQYEKFRYKIFSRTWRRPTKALDLTVNRSDKNRLETIKALLSGTIRFNRADRRYYCRLVRKDAGGEKRDYRIAASVDGVIDFFNYGGGSFEYEDVAEELYRLNDEYLTPMQGDPKAQEKALRLRRLLALIDYYMDHHFQATMDFGDRGLLRDLRKALSAEVESVYPPGVTASSEFRDEQVRMSDWLQSFVVLAPVFEIERDAKPDDDWLPVLVREPRSITPEIMRENLLWHNMYNSPDAKERAPEDIRRKPAWAMVAGQENRGWTEVYGNTDGTTVPDDIRRMIWGPNAN